MAALDQAAVGAVVRPWRRPAWLAWAALAAIMVAAVALRVMVPGVAEFKSDEVQPLALADAIWREHRLPLTRGVSSTGLPGTPLVAYLLVPAQAASADPRLGVVTMGLLGSLAVLTTYLGVRRFASERLALIAAALYAVNPWAVLFSRKTWSDVLPLFTALALWAACEVIVHRRPRWALVFFPLLALQVQAHVIAVVLLPAVVLTVLLFWPRWRNRYTLWGVALGALILLPYIWVLLHQWAATKAVVKQSVAHGPIVDLRVLAYGLWFASGQTVTALMGRSVGVLQGWEQALRGTSVLVGLLVALGLGRSVRAIVLRRGGWERQALLLLWLAGPAVPLVFVRGAMDIHYLQLMLPALFVLVGIAWALLLGSRLQAVSVAALAAFALLLTIQGSAVLALYDGLARYPTDGGFGRPLNTWLEVRRRVQARVASEGGPEVVVLGIDDASWSSERAVVDYLLGRNVRLRYVGQGGRLGLLVPEQGDVPALVLGVDGQLAQALCRYGEEVEHLPIPGNEWGVRFYRLHGRNRADLAHEALLRSGATFENGMRLLGVRVEGDGRPGGRLVVTSFWAFTGDVKGANDADMAFHHLLGPGDRRWAQYDGFAWSRNEWRPGYTLVQWFDLGLPKEMPAGDYWLYTGMYSWRDMKRARVVDETGRPGADGVRLGPIRVHAAGERGRAPGTFRSGQALWVLPPVFDATHWLAPA